MLKNIRQRKEVITMKWGIIGAMPSEVTLLKQQMQDICEVNVGRQVFWEGILCNQEVVVSSCRYRQGKCCYHRTDDDRPLRQHSASSIPVSPAQSTMTSRFWTLWFPVSCATTTTTHASCVTIRHISIPSGASDLMIEAAVEAFEAIDHGSSCCFVGKIASGDQFIESSEVKNKIVEEHHPMCVEMEGAAIGHACTVNDIPFVIIRTMSDNADDNATESYDNFEELAAEHSANIVLEMLSRCKD